MAINFDEVNKVFSYVSQVAQIAPTVIASAQKVTDPAATAADKLAAVQKDVQMGHAIATANGETTQTFDEFWGALSPIASLIISFL